IGTSALRQAGNKDWFLHYIYQKLGVEIEVVTGYKEAWLSFSGVVKDIGVGSLENILVLDIGGGSTEFILGNRSLEIALIKSIDIGCVNLTEKFLKSDPPSREELTIVRSFIKGSLENVTGEINRQKYVKLVGVAGTVTTICAIDLGLEKYDSEKIHHHVLGIKNIRSIYDNLCRLNLARRKEIVGLEPRRADIIVAGTAILLEIMELLGRREVLVSERDILDGIIYSLVDFC
ncbi:MAG: exopolyphosphatase, partial [Actinobacteria bacterium]|nr:exopolyphosphatase [Actinomycetota bacterium]